MTVLFSRGNLNFVTWDYKAKLLSLKPTQGKVIKAITLGLTKKLDKKAS